MRAHFALVVAFCALALGVVAARADTAVDVELVLAVDVSRSVSARELEIQRRGYAEALTSREVLTAIKQGAYGRIALTYIEWAGAGSQRIVVDWTLIDNAAGAFNFADRLTAFFDATLRRTSISAALAYSADRFDGNGFAGTRRVIDVSGDGPNNSGLGVAAVRDAVLARGIIINGLPLMTREGMGQEWDLPDLDHYYAACVTGGPGAFVIPVRGWAEFPAAVRRKLVQELAALPVRPATYHVVPQPAYDCWVGEKIWERIYRSWEYP